MKSKDKFSFIRYSNCWEDTDILLEALDIKEGEIGLSVASAGDNSLAMLIKDPERVYAFDINKTQLYCLELKICCFKYLTYHEMLEFLGVEKCRDRMALFGKLSCGLGNDAREYFVQNSKLIKKGIIHTGKFERAFHIFRSLVIPLIGGGKMYRTFAAMEDPKMQAEYYRKHINNKRMRLLFRIFFGYRVLGSLGRDKDFYKYVEEKKESGNDLRSRFEYGISNVPNGTNPYISYIVNRTYSKKCLPLYLRKEYFDKIKRNADRITPVLGDLSSVRGRHFDFLNLSDIFEYMSDDDFQRNITALKDMATDGARICYWNMQNKRYTDEFAFDKESSEELFRQNKSWFYRDFLVYRKK